MLGSRDKGGGWWGGSSQTFRMESWAHPGSSSDVWVLHPITPASVPAMAPCLNVPPPCPQTTWLFARLPPPGPSSDVRASSTECQASAILAGPPDHARGKATLGGEAARPAQPQQLPRRLSLSFPKLSTSAGHHVPWARGQTTHHPTEEEPGLKRPASVGGQDCGPGGQWAPRPARACEPTAGFWAEAYTAAAGDGGEERAQPLLSHQVPVCSPTHGASPLSCGTEAVALLCWGPAAWLQGQLGPAPTGQGSRAELQPAAARAGPPLPTTHLAPPNTLDSKTRSKCGARAAFLHTCPQNKRATTPGAHACVPEGRGGCGVTDNGGHTGWGGRGRTGGWPSALREPLVSLLQGTRGGEGARGLLRCIYLFPVLTWKGTQP